MGFCTKYHVPSRKYEVRVTRRGGQARLPQVGEIRNLN